MVKFYLLDKNTGKTYGPILGMINKDGINEYIYKGQDGTYESICSTTFEIIRVGDGQDSSLPPKNR